MSTPITITITAQTAQAAADLQKFAQQAGNSLKVIGQTANEAGQHIAGMSYYARSAIDSIRLAAAGGGDRAAFYAVDELTRGLLASGMALSRLVPVLGTIGLGVGAAVYAWHAWNDANEQAIKNAKDLADAWKELPGLLKQINDMQQVGLLGPGAASEYTDYLTGKKKLYVDENGKVTTSPTRQVQEPVYLPGAGMAGGIPAPSYYRNVAENNPEASQKQAQDYFKDQSTAGGQLTKERLDALERLREETRKLNEESLSGVEKLKAEARDAYEADQQRLELDLQIAKAKVGAGGYENNLEVKAAEEALAKSKQAEAQKLAEIEQKAQDEQLQKLAELQQKYTDIFGEVAKDISEISAHQAEADKKHTEELQRQLSLEGEIARAKTEASLRGIEGDPFLTNQAKRQQSIPLYQQMLDQNAGRIGQLSGLASSTSDPAAALEAQKQIVELTQQQVELQQKLNAARGTDSFSYQVHQMVTDMQNLNVSWQDVRETAEHIGSSTMTNFNSQLAQALVVTGNFHKMWIDIGRTLLTQVVEAILTIIEKELIVLAVDTLIKIVTGYAEGGYTGDGAPDEAAGIVHKGEYVMPASTVRSIGLDNLRALHSGDFSVMDTIGVPSLDNHTALELQGRAGSPAMAAAGGNKVNIHFHGDRISPKEYLNSGDGVNHVIDIARKNRLKIGIGT